MLIPHYQALGRERLGLDGVNLMLWVVFQNVAAGIASVVMGPLADRFGNRFTLRIAIFGTIIFVCVVLISYATFNFIPNQQSPLTATLITNTSIVGVVIASYFGASAYIQASENKSKHSSEPTKQVDTEHV